MGRRGAQPIRRRRSARAGVVVAAVCLAGPVACGGAGEPVPDAVTSDELAAVRDRLDALEDRVGDLADDVTGLSEAPASADPADDPADDEPADDEPADDEPADDELLAQVRGNEGEQVTVRATVSELVGTTGLGSAFRVAGPSGSTVPVVSATPVPGLAAGDVVRVTGVVARVAEESFEEDFGIAAAQLLDDPAAFFAASSGRLALSATEVDDEQGGD